MQLDALWQFMQVDMDADRFEAKMRQSENRQKLIKQRNFLMEQQTNMKKLESDISVMKDRLEAIGDESIRLEKVLNGLLEDIETNPPKDADDAAQKMEAVKKLLNTLTRYEHELQKMRQDSENRDRQQKEIRVRAAKTKVEYDQLKKQYDVEFKSDSEKLNQMRANIEQEAKRVDAKLLERYHAIKQHCTPPMARLINGQCSGCFMSLPSATMLVLKDKDKIVECDNCGRIIYAED